MRPSAVAALLVVAAGCCAPSAAAAPPGCAALAGTIRDGVCLAAQTTPDYVLDLRFPTDYPDQQAVVDYLAETREGFLNVARPDPGATPDTRGRPYELDVTAESYRSARTRSVVLTLFQNVGGAHPTTWYKSFTYDVDRNRPVTFDGLFAAGTDPLPAILPTVRRDLEGATGLSGSIAESDGLDPAHYQNFAVTDDALIFFFGRGELLPSYAGATSVTLPRTAIPPLQI